MSEVRVRFAPSPTGSPHIGTVRTAVFDYLFARHTGGSFILRIEDTDRTRYVEGSLEEIMQGLRWLGMQWDEGPEVGGEYGPYFQSERLAFYSEHARRLVDEGKAYYCYCTRERLDELRKAQEAEKKATGYDRRCRELSPEDRQRMAAQNPNPVVRFAMKREGRTQLEDIVRGTVAFDNALQDDFVMIKADGFPTYHFASVVDDHLMEISHVVRGDEWLPSAPKHVQLYEALGWTPPAWVHPPLILDTSGRKLAKRSGFSTAVVDYIRQGYLPDAMLNFLATMGWSSGEDKKLYSRQELIEAFSLEGIVNHPAVFDIDKLNDLQGEYVRMMSVGELAKAILPRLQAAGHLGDAPSKEDMDYLGEVTALIRERIVLLSDAPEHVSFFYSDDFEYEDKGFRKYLSKDTVPALLKTVIVHLEKQADWSAESIEAAVRAAGAEQGAEGSAVIHPVRMAVTGRTWGPGLFELMQVLGRGKCASRLRRAAEASAQAAQGAGS